MKTLTDLIEAHASQLESFATAPDFPKQAPGLLLPPRLWQIVEALGNGATAAELAPRLCMPQETLLAALRALETAGHVSKVLIPWPGVAALPAVAPAPVSAAAAVGQPEMLAVEAAALAALPADVGIVSATTEKPAASQAREPAAQPKAPAILAQPRKGAVVLKFAARSRPAMQPSAEAAPAVPAAPALPPAPPVEARSAARPAPVSLRLGAANRKTTAASAGNTPTPAAQANGEATRTTDTRATSAAASQQQSWPLQPVLDALRAKTGGDPMVGQLLAYRVFLRVPGDLLQAAGIRSVCLIEPDLVIRDPKLKKAMETALQEVAGLSWPSAVPAAA